MCIQSDITTIYWIKEENLIIWLWLILSEVFLFARVIRFSSFVLLSVSFFIFRKVIFIVLFFSCFVFHLFCCSWAFSHFLISWIQSFPVAWNISAHAQCMSWSLTNIILSYYNFGLFHTSHFTKYIQNKR